MAASPGSEYAEPEPEPEYAGECLEEANVYKATSSSDFVVVRHCRLYRSKFVTYHSFEENKDDNKQWLLDAQCELQPRSAADIREPCTKYVRPRGQWAITTLVKPKSIGTKGRSVTLYTFTLVWPTRWATKGYTSFTFGFPSAEEARHWHSRLAECLESKRRERLAAAGAGASVHGTANGGTGRSDRSSNGGRLGSRRLSGLGGSVAPPSADSAAALRKSTSISRRGQVPETASAQGSPRGSQVPSPLPGGRHRRSLTEMPDASKRALLFDESVHAPKSVEGASVGNGGGLSSAAFTTSLPNLPPPPSPPPAAPVAPAAASTKPPRPPAVKPSAAAPPPRLDVAFQHDSSDSDSDADQYEEPTGGQMDGAGRLAGASRRSRSGAAARLGGGGAPCRLPRATARGDVRQTKQSWVPYKQVNGVAIYHRRETAGDAQAGVGGEFMVSTVVRGSPRRCLRTLTSHCSNTTILGPATRVEVLQRRQAEDEKEIQRIILQAPGLTGVLCAPRELVVETVYKIDETGPTLVLMFQSCEAPARFVERRAGDPAPGQAGAEDEDEDGVETYQAAPEGARRSWWRTPVSARVQGGYTLAPLEEFSLDSSPEALVTCIMKVDLGGVCGQRSWLRLASDLVGWTDAFLDRMLMAVTLLRDEVEQDRFVAQPLNMMTSRVTDRLNASAYDLQSQGARSGEVGNLPPAAATAAGGAGAGARRGLQCITTALAGAVAARDASGGGMLPSPCGATSRRRDADRAAVAAAEAEQDGPANGVAAGTAGRADAPAAATSAFAGAGGALAAAEVAAAEMAAGPLKALRPQYETMEDVLARMRRLAFLNPSVWDQLHQPGKDAPFKIRGPTYLKDRKKIPAGTTRFVLGSMDVIAQPPGPVVEHVARFLPSVRESGAPFSLIVHLVIPGTPLLGIVATFVTDRHPATLGSPPASPMEDEHEWEPFDFVLHKYMTGSTHARNHMLKLIPHIADGSWMIKQSVGTTPVILGKQLRTIYYETPQYLEIDIDISANNVASYVTGLVRGATRSLVIDMGFVLEGTTPWELPEALLGTLRLYNLDIRDAKPIDINNEIPLKPPTVAPRAPSPATAAAAAAAAAAKTAAAATHGSVSASGSLAPSHGSVPASAAAGGGDAPPLSSSNSVPRPSPNTTAGGAAGGVTADLGVPAAALGSPRLSSAPSSPV